MSDSPEDRTICFCHNVSHAQLVSAIRAGATTLVDIQADTCASTGCGGCEYEVLEILEAEAEAAATTAAAATSSGGEEKA